MKKLSTYFFEIGAIRPPSEGGSYSLLIRATRNCSWNRCKFCYGMAYNHEKFQLRAVEEIKKDIQVAKAISDEIKQVSWQLGYAGRINGVVGAEIYSIQLAQLRWTHGLPSRCRLAYYANS